MSVDVGTLEVHGSCVYSNIHDLEGHIHYYFLSDLGQGMSAFSWPTNMG